MVNRKFNKISIILNVLYPWLSALFWLFICLLKASLFDNTHLLAAVYFVFLKMNQSILHSKPSFDFFQLLDFFIMHRFTIKFFFDDIANFFPSLVTSFKNFLTFYRKIHTSSFIRFFFIYTQFWIEYA